MDQSRFSVSDALRFGWGETKRNIGFLAAVVLIALLAFSGPAALQKELHGGYPFLSFLIGLSALVIRATLVMGLVKVSLMIADGQTPGIADLLGGIELFLFFLFGVALYLLMVAGGLILFVVPAVVWALQFLFFVHAMVDRRVGPIEALAESSRLTRGSRLDLLVLVLVLVGVNLAGAVCLGIGLLVTIPLSMLASARVYRRLQQGIRAEELRPGES
jgi:uncharacterized membrane protein